MRFLHRKRFSWAEVAIDAGLLFVAIGGGWLILSRWGATPLGFQEPIILLTAGHFHYAGLTLPILVGLAGKQLQNLISRIATVGVISGVPLVAFGITVKHLKPEWALVEGISAWYLSLVCMLVVVMQFQIMSFTRHRLQRMLFFCSGLSLLVSMTLAIVYALGMYLGTEWLDIPTMLITHALLNVVGFALSGLLAYNVEGLN